MSTPIVVLGMHRSGTSALTGALAGMGCFVGFEGELTSASHENPNGFFERRDLRTICDALLFSADADWWKVSSFETDAISLRVRAEQQKAFASVVEKMAAAAGDQEGWCIKEPRLCLLLPVLEGDLTRPLCLIPFRNPIEVARSLRQRNGFPLAAGAALWESYIVSALQHSAHHPRAFVDYAALVQDPRAVLFRLADELGKHGFSGLDPEAGAATIEPTLHRACATEAENPHWLSAQQREVFAALRSGKPPEAPVLSDRAFEILQEFETDEAARQHLLQAVRLAKSAAKTTSAELDKVKAALEREKVRSRGLVAAAERSAADARTECERAQIAATQAKRECDDALAIAREAKELADLRKQETARIIQEIGKERERHLKEIMDFRESTSWRITAPLRYLKRFAFGKEGHGQ